MIDKKWIVAGYVAAVTSIILVVLLLGIALSNEYGNGKDKGESGSAASSAQSSEGAAEISARSGEKAESAELGLTWEEPGAASSAVEQTDAQEQIQALSGSDLWKRFEGAVLTGDSRVVGFSLYTDIPDSNVLARNGAVIDALDEFTPKIAALGPSRVFVAYGINDIMSETGGKTAKSYAAYAEEKIGKLEAALEDAEIFVNSILPASPSLEKSDSKYQKVQGYNKELREMCLRRGWHYIDNGKIAAKYADLYAGDGIHLQAGFYEHWGRNMLLTECSVHNNEGGTGVDW